MSVMLVVMLGPPGTGHVIHVISQQYLHCCRPVVTVVNVNNVFVTVIHIIAYTKPRTYVCMYVRM